MSTKKEKVSKQLTPEKLKEMREAYLKEAQIYKDRVMPLVQFLRKNKLRFNNAHIGHDRVEYFRLDEFQKLVQANKDQIEANQKLDQLVKNYLNELVYFKRPENVKIKYPNTLEPVPQSHPQKKYASFRFDTTQSKSGMTILVIGLILAMVLFPIWPFSVKYGIWWVSLALLVLMVGIIVIRLAIYVFFSIFNYHIWLFPDLFYATGILESFIPVFQINKGDSSWFSLFLRMFAVSSFILLSVHIYLNPTFIQDNISFTKETILEMHDWGVSKLKKQGNFSQSALTNLQTILNETSDNTTEKHQTFEQSYIDTEEQLQQTKPASEDLQNGNDNDFGTDTDTGTNENEGEI